MNRDAYCRHRPILDETARRLRRYDAFVGLVIASVLFLVYRPVWHGNFLWDDDAHVTRPEMRSMHGLYRIWFDIGATPQYYPLTHSAFWIEEKIWGDAPLGYHLVNIALHALSALLVLRVLRRLEVPGASWAAAIFALHPLQVESVAWISELKNTLSGALCLAALLAYLRFDRGRAKSWYAVALLLFGLALLSKTVTAVLPAVVLLIFWWRRGRLAWRRDVVPLIPWFLLAAAAGALTAWVERRLMGAEGADFDFHGPERFLIAGRVLWFYLGKLFWPTNLVFIYPRWPIHQAGLWQAIFPVSALGVLLALWRIRGRTRAPLAAGLCYAGTLFPVLGFFNVYPFRYSFVADHFQYLAGLAVIAIATGGGATYLGKSRPRRALGRVLGTSLLALLAVLSWRQSRIYADVETLYRATLAGNPDCWLAHNNLGNVLFHRGQLDAAIAQCRAALQTKPDFAEAHTNLGNALAARGQLHAAIAQYRRALDVKPREPETHYDLALVLVGCGAVDEAIAHFQKALEFRPDYAAAHNNLANALLSRGRVDEAIGHCQAALEIQPGLEEAHNNLANALLRRGRVEEAVAQYQKALELQPGCAEVHNNLGSALASCGRVDEAIVHYQKALEIQPGQAEARYNLGNALASRGRLDEAISQYRKAVAIAPTFASAQANLAVAEAEREGILKGLAERRESLRSRPNDAAILNDIAWTLATNPNASVRDGAEAITLAQRALKLSGGGKAAFLDTLGAAYAEAARFHDAIQAAQGAIELAERLQEPALAERIRARLNSYQARAPYRELRRGT
jgi:tetratricopeptide (TPR) repeat protein